MEILTAELVHDTGKQRFYKLSQKITKGMRLTGKVNLIEALKEEREKRIKPEYRDYCPVDGLDLICISDARTHLERLVFGAVKVPSGYGRLTIQIGGVYTFMIHGGDARSMKPDYVYLRSLAKLNGLEFHYSNYATEKAEIL